MPNITAVVISRRFEQCRLTAYFDTVAGVWTIGWGHTGADVYDGLVWTQDQANQDQATRLDRVEKQVRGLLTRELPSGAIGALISLADNAGIGIEINSRLIAAVNRGDWIAAADEFADDDHCKGAEIAGLKKRRYYEAYYFLDAVA